MVGEVEHDPGDKEERRKRQEAGGGGAGGGGAGGRRLRSLLSSYYGVGHSEDPTQNDPSNIDRCLFDKIEFTFS